MRFTLFATQFRPSQLKDLPELSHFSLPEDRWVLARHHFWVVRHVILSGLILMGTAFLIRRLPENAIDPEIRGLILILLYVTAVSVGLFAIPRYLTKRSVRGLHRILRTRNIHYCPAFKCRYNCTGIRGNICPECGSTVPGLTASE
ncbi:MAG: hypothetical protein RLN60_00065 [Phycisphaerales bacterium]